MIVTSEKLNEVRADFADQTIALRLGCYDILHYGHQEGIDFASSQADILAIGVMPDEFIAKRKGRVSINSIERRLEAVDVAEGVDISFAVPNIGRLAVSQMFFGLRPDVFVDGEEHDKKLLKSILLSGIGVRYVIDRSSKVESSSNIISRFGPARAARLSSLNFHSSLLTSEEAFQVGGK